MTRDADSIEQRIVGLFATQLNFEVPSNNTDLFETGVLDSLSFVQLLLHLEQEFGVKASLDDLAFENFRCIEKIAAFVLSRGPVAVSA